MRSKYIKHVMLVLIWIATISDSYFAITYRPFLEANPLVLQLGIWPVVLLKFFTAGIVTYWLFKGKYTKNSQVFRFAAAILLLIIIWGIVVGSLYFQGGEAYDPIELEIVHEYEDKVLEETGSPPTEEQTKTFVTQVRLEVKKNLNPFIIPIYVRLVYTYGVYPLIFSILTFFIYERLLVTAKFKKPRQGKK